MLYRSYSQNPPADKRSESASLTSYLLPVFSYPLVLSEENPVAFLSDVCLSASLLIKRLRSLLTHFLNALFRILPVEFLGSSSMGMNRLGTLYAARFFSRW